MDSNNIALYNDQPLDTWSDIIVSFEYERFALSAIPTGGFAVGFFDAIVDIPRNGGPNYSLGYAPSTEKEYCYQAGFPGLQAAFLGVGFDNKGLFAVNQFGRPGIPLTNVNNNQTLTVRGGVAENYNVLKHVNLTQILSTLPNSNTFTIDGSASAPDKAFTRSVRIALKNHATKLIVQLKDSPDRNEFDTVLELSLPEKKRSALKVALTNTQENNTTQFKVKNFNVAGFPGIVTDQKIEGCTFQLEQKNYGINSGILCVGDEFITTTLPNQVVTYTTDTVKYNLKNVIYTGSGIRTTGISNNYVVGVYDNKPLVGIFKYLGEKLAKSGFVATPDNQLPLWADLDSKNGTLAVLTRAVSGAVYIFNYIENSDNPLELGNWKLYQTIPYTPSIHSNNGFLNKVKINENNLLINTGNQTVLAYRKNISNVWTYIQTLSAEILPLTVTSFGEEFAISKDNLLVGAPASQKIPFPEPTQGEVYHYVYSATKGWQLAMTLGSFYRINTPLGTFGASIAFDGDVCAIGSPGEEYRFIEEDKVYINIGRVHVFRKTANGLFSQGTSYVPDIESLNTWKRNIFFGSRVALKNNFLFSLSPFSQSSDKSYITIMNLACKFPMPPPQIEIPGCALIAFDNQSFILDTITDTYMLSYVCREGLG